MEYKICHFLSYDFVGNIFFPLINIYGVMLEMHAEMYIALCVKFSIFHM
jgi:hypothetical protein